MSAITLFRPVGPKEHELIKASGFRRFPPRLPEQPIFYPVVQEEYAKKIAREWNVKADGSGYVTRFDVRTEYLAQFDEHVAGGRDHTEYWIPAERLNELNDNIVGRIMIVAEYHAEEWVTAYDLAEDAETIENIQRATSTTTTFGVVPDVALYGSEDWWMAIAEGRIPKHVTRGVISRVFMTGHGDWPEFELDGGGALTQWTRLGDRSLYVVGREVKIEYVMQRSRHPSLNGAEQKHVLRVLVKRSAIP